MKGIYQIRNVLNEKLYIGSSFNIKARWYQHKSYLKRGVHSNKKLQNGVNKYGIDNFEFSVLEECDEIVEREQHYIDTLNSWYNIREEASSNKGTKFKDTSKMQLAAVERNKRVHNVKVLLYNLDGSFYKRCDSVKEASIECEVSGGGCVANCRDRVHFGKCGKYMVKSDSESPSLTVEPYRRFSKEYKNRIIQKV